MNDRVVAVQPSSHLCRLPILPPQLLQQPRRLLACKGRRRHRRICLDRRDHRLLSDGPYVTLVVVQPGQRIGQLAQDISADNQTPRWSFQGPRHE